MLTLLLSGCGHAAIVVATPTPDSDQTMMETGAMTELTPLPGNLDQPIQFEDEIQYEINAILPRDGIRPIYEPHFVSAADAQLSIDELVMGVEINEDARAYSVSVLRTREMVNDEVGGRPILVTW